MSGPQLIEWLLMGCSVALLIVIVIFGAQIMRGAFDGRIDALDLVLGKANENGRRQISDEKLWTHIGKALLVYAMIKDAGDGHPDATLQGGLFIAIAAHEVFIRWRAHVEKKELPVTGGTTVLTDKTVRTQSVEKVGKGR